MPVIGIPVDKLNKMLRLELDMDTLLDRLTQIGCDIDSVTSLFRLRCNKCENIEEFYTQDNPPKQCGFCNADWKEGEITNLEPVRVIRMELLPVRPDTFDSGGLARMLRGFLGKEKGIPPYKTNPGSITVKVDESVNSDECLRPYIACAVMRNMCMDEEFIKLIMNLQENLHWALGRNRKLASIGVYDLDTIEPDIEYTSVPMSESPFSPLGYPDTVMTPREVLEKHHKGIQFANLLKGFKRAPVLRDSKGTILSMPPIINSDSTKVGFGTKNFFIDVTGLSERVVEKTMNIITTSILEYFPDAVLEQVNVKYPDKTEITPDFTPEEKSIETSAVNKLLGLNLSDEEVLEHLRKMRYDVKKEDGKILVFIPAFRNDIMHERDIIEDVAISYGYRNFVPTMPSAQTVGSEKEKRTAENNACSVMTGLGYLEVSTLILTNEYKNYTQVLQEILEERVQIENPISSEQTMLRTNIFPGFFEIFQKNIHNELPQKVFEVGEVVFYEAKHGSKENIRIALAIMDSKSTFSLIKGEVESYLRETGQKYRFEPSNHPFFMQSRQVDIFVTREGGEVRAGFFGEVHPQILSNWNLNQPVAFSEIDIA